ncbi:MAG: DNA/RNA non-specific endonuclease, partial [Micrococcales bacterium]|nr:DNA/RNA non-specific endonuclease [Micrococcales bacterium]
LIDPVSGRNFGTLENDLASIIRTDPDVVVDFKVRPVYEGDSRVPVRIETRYRVDGGDWRREVFENVKR